MQSMGINSIGDLANTNVELLRTKFGINGQKMYDNANGINQDEVRLYYQPHIPKSIGNSTTLPQDIKSIDQVAAVLTALSEMVAIRMRKYNFCAAGIGVGIRYNDLTGVGKQVKMDSTTSTASEIRDAALQLFLAINVRDLPIRALSVSTFDLREQEQQSAQMSLFDAPIDDKHSRLDKSIDELRKKYGYNVVQSARVMSQPYICQDLQDSDFLPFKK